MPMQRTIAKPCELTGVGLHSGESCTVRFHPAPPGHGLVFVRTDLPGAPSLPCRPDLLCIRQRRTALAIGEVEVHTCEHLLAACHGLGVDNLRCELTAVELPGMDGSARDFVAVLESAGLVEQGVERSMFSVDQPVAVSEGRSTLTALPYRGGLKITYSLDDHGGALGGAQLVELELNADTFRDQIASARTFCLKKEVDMLRAAGLGKGATYENTCVYDGNQVVGTTLRFRDEAARHKLLDLIGDLAHCSHRLNAHIVAVRSGHKENMLLVQELNRRIAEQTRERRTFDLQQILALIPHRYPFLLVDRITDYEPGKRIVGQKNVTANEPYFQGHFPGRPVMPGVLQIEAMAQVGAVLLMTEMAPEERAAGRIPYFMSVDKVRFRRAVVPGDVLRIEVAVLRQRSRMSACAARTYVGDQLACEAEIRSVMMER